MMTANALSERRGEAYDRLVRQEELILDVTERLTVELLKAGVTKAELARRLDRTPGFVSQVFGGGRNLTLRTISDIAAALSVRPSFEMSPDSRSLRNTPWEQSGFRTNFHWRPKQRIATSAPVAPSPPVRAQDQEGVGALAAA